MGHLVAAFYHNCFRVRPKARFMVFSFIVPFIKYIYDRYLFIMINLFTTQIIDELESWIPGFYSISSWSIVNSVFSGDFRGLVCFLGRFSFARFVLCCSST